MTPSDRLFAAEQAAREGRHEEALREFVWFHHHALEQEPDLVGVRLSYAMRFWGQLAHVYPQARRELEAVRDEKTALLSGGGGERQSFLDVVAINEALDDEMQTSLLFEALSVGNPPLAERCAAEARRALIGAGMFTLAAHFLPTPEVHLRELHRWFHDDVERDPGMLAQLRDAFIEACVHRHAGDIKLLFTILRGSGRGDEACRLRTLALDLVHTVALRVALARALDQQPGEGMH